MSVMPKCEKCGRYFIFSDGGPCTCAGNTRIATLEAENAALRAEVEAMQEDAERWIEVEQHFRHERCGPNVGWTIGDLVLQGDTVTDAVDAAIEQRKDHDREDREFNHQGK